MGNYINPSTMTKEDFLRVYGKPITEQVAEGVGYDVNSLTRLVCLVANPMFTAAGVIESKEEFEAFTRPSDLRPKLFLLVPVKDLTREGGLSYPVQIE